MSDVNAIRLNARANNLWARAIKTWPELARLEMPDIRINSRLKTTAGRSHSVNNWLDFNAYLLETNANTMLEDTLPHEMAHNIADRLFNSVGHDTAWRAVYFKLTGKEAARLHNMDVSAMRANRRTYKYKCDCRDWDFTGQRNALYMKGHGYKCPKCGKNIHPKG
jgi:SprT protein